MASRGTTLVLMLLLLFGIDDAHAFRAMGVDNSLQMDAFRENFEVKVHEITKDMITFEMVGIAAPIANALRRILLSEVPTMAIENINLYNNTSIIQDEVLASRLGLIPIRADPRKFKFVSGSLLFFF
jgi:DNA-directed RNA polymerase I and III subunit RPAC1